MNNERGVAHLLIITIVLLAGVAIAVYLLQFSTVFKPKADESTEGTQVNVAAPEAPNGGGQGDQSGAGFMQTDVQPGAPASEPDSGSTNLTVNAPNDHDSTAGPNTQQDQTAEVNSDNNNQTSADTNGNNDYTANTNPDNNNNDNNNTSDYSNTNL